MAREDKMIDSYKRLPLGMYLDICELCADENTQEIDKQVAIISRLSGMTEEEILDLPITKYKELSAKTYFLSMPSTEDHSMISDKYLAGDYVLEPCMDIRNLTTAQYIDFQTFAPMADTKVAEILSCFLIPKGCKYNKGYDIVDVQDAIKRYLSVSDALSLSAFFLSRFHRLILDSLISSRKEVMKMKDNQMKEEMLKRIERQMTVLQGSGDGLRM